MNLLNFAVSVYLNQKTKELRLIYHIFLTSSLFKYKERGISLLNHETNSASPGEQLIGQVQIIHDLISQTLEHTTQQESGMTVNEFDKNRENHSQELREKHKAFGKNHHIRR